jgi:cell division protein FtsA
MAKTDIIVGVEVGTAKVCAVVAESGRDTELRILGVGMVPSRGVRKGEIIDLAIATECVHDALAEAETNSNIEISDVSVAVTGGHIASFNSRGAVPIPEDRMEIEEEDLTEVAIKAREVNIPTDNTFLHSIIQHYYVDGQEGVLDPVGLVGRRLEADFHIVHGMKTRLQNTLRCLEENGMNIEDVVINSLASSHAILNDHQRELGAVVIDIGGGVSDYIVFAEGAVRHSGVLAVGGDHISNDISMGLRIPLTRAERLKVEEGSALLGQSRPGEKIILKNDAGFSGKEVEREMLNMIIHARMSELLQLIARDVTKETPAHMLGAGVFLAGGCTYLRGIREIAEEIFEMPVHLARDAGASGPKSILANPQFSTAIGIVKFVHSVRSEEEEPGLLDKLFGGLFRKH